jgi:hypothetical protein
MKLSILILAALFSLNAFSGFDGILKIEGEVIDKDQCDIKIKQANGAELLLPLEKYKKFISKDKKLMARLSVEDLRLSFGHVVKRGSDLGGGSNTRGSDLGGGSNTRGSDLGGGSNTRDCRLRNKMSANSKEALDAKAWIIRITSQLTD